jgi:Fur family transcriptional regulator, ferric uptake regulator
MSRPPPTAVRDGERATDTIATGCGYNSASYTRDVRTPATQSGDAAEPAVWQEIRARLRERGLRWTPQRRLILEVLEETKGHVTGSSIVERCRDRDPDTTPSTVYRTLDVLEELGYLSHSHSARGREEFHVLPETEHAHLQCRSCDQTWELDAADARRVTAPLRREHGFRADLGHLTISGTCATCLAASR